LWLAAITVATTLADAEPDGGQWYKNAVFYQALVRAYRDGDGDGYGDLRGLIDQLDYLQLLGVDCVWLNPIYPSPLKDGGYDVSNYTDIHPNAGTLDDFRELVAKAHQRGIRIIVDFVPNHSSDQHPWFEESRRDPDGPYGDYYVWSDSPEQYYTSLYTDEAGTEYIVDPETGERRDIDPESTWLRITSADGRPLIGPRIIFTDTETSNWTWDPVRKQYFWHRFFSHQPDLNFENPAVRQEILAAQEFWLRLGVDGFRVDAVPYLFVREGTNGENLPQTHEFVRQMRAFADRYGAMILCEANQPLADLMQYFGDPATGGDGFHMAFDFALMPRLYMALASEVAEPIRDVLRLRPELPASAALMTFLDNHDERTTEMVTRAEREYLHATYDPAKERKSNDGFVGRLAPLLGNDLRKVKLANAMLFALTGSPIIYYGDELGMGDNPALPDRDAQRTPMPWTPDRNAGFSTAAPYRPSNGDPDPRHLYLPPVADPVNGYRYVNVENQVYDESSLLHWTRGLIAAYKSQPALANGKLTDLGGSNGHVLTIAREYDGDVVLGVFNLAGTTQATELDLSAWIGRRPTDVIGDERFRTIDDLPYSVTLEGHGFRWLALNRPEVASGNASAVGEMFSTAGRVDDNATAVAALITALLGDAKTKAAVERLAILDGLQRDPADPMRYRIVRGDRSRTVVFVVGDVANHAPAGFEGADTITITVSRHLIDAVEVLPAIGHELREIGELLSGTPPHTAHERAQETQIALLGWIGDQLPGSDPRAAVRADLALLDSANGLRLEAGAAGQLAAGLDADLAGRVEARLSRHHDAGPQLRPRRYREQPRGGPGSISGSSFRGDGRGQAEPDEVLATAKLEAAEIARAAGVAEVRISATELVIVLDDDSRLHSEFAVVDDATFTDAGPVRLEGLHRTDSPYDWTPWSRVTLSARATDDVVGRALANTVAEIVAIRRGDNAHDRRRAGRRAEVAFLVERIEAGTVDGHPVRELRLLLEQVNKLENEPLDGIPGILPDDLRDRVAAALRRPWIVEQAFGKVTAAVNRLEDKVVESAAADRTLDPGNDHSDRPIAIALYAARRRRIAGATGVASIEPRTGITGREQHFVVRRTDNTTYHLTIRFDARPAHTSMPNDDLEIAVAPGPWPAVERTVVEALARHENGLRERAGQPDPYVDRFLHQVLVQFAGRPGPASRRTAVHEQPLLRSLVQTLGEDRAVELGSMSAQEFRRRSDSESRQLVAGVFAQLRALSAKQNSGNRDERRAAARDLLELVDRLNLRSGTDESRALRAAL
ncbi:alpha-amylase family glycosyl hydrolase, partial [Kribbella sp.]|uniref:alpha-amylase family glycosyl hydrolase n=1 Tax=Kribbella sp. TaxID=1871183 RepID=UPI002D646417